MAPGHAAPLAAPYCCRPCQKARRHPSSVPLRPSLAPLPYLLLLLLLLLLGRPGWRLVVGWPS